MPRGYVPSAGNRRRKPVYAQPKPFTYGRGAVVFAMAVMGMVAMAHHVLAAPVLHVAGRNIRLEIADTPKEQAQGLSGRTGLAKDAGMLFVFDRPDAYAFWMKDMKFPIDIVWLSKGRVVDEKTMYPPTQLTPTVEKYIPRQTADRVLELPAGMADELGLKVGTTIKLPR